VQALNSVQQHLTNLTLEECAHALGVSTWPPTAKRVATIPFAPFARRMGAELGRFNSELPAHGLANAAARLLRQLHAVPRVHQVHALPEKGPLLIVANHPGVYDAMSLFSALPRPDLRLIAADRPFLRALPNLLPHLMFVLDAPQGAPAPANAHGTRWRGLREAVNHLKSGGAILHFGAGRIEPDPAFHRGADTITHWQLGSGRLAQACAGYGGDVHVAVVSGVHAERLKRSLVIRMAEARGVTTLAGMLQVAMPRLTRVAPEVRFSAPIKQLGNDVASATQALEQAARELLSAQA
jgi:hypothetical protein